MFLYMAAMLPIVILWRLAAVRCQSARGVLTNAWHEMGVVLFTLLLVGLASQAIIPDYTVTEKGILFSFWTGPLSERINVIPFHFLKVMKASLQMGEIQYFLLNIVGNILIFAPIGFFVPLLWHRRTIRQVTAIGFLCSLVIEIVQLPQNRWTDVDDLILNTLGALLGCLLYCLLHKAAPRLTDSFKVKK
ncbi:MAG: VanZ family protein [Clostridiales bacterium]|nr:VanZ family protein [Clostridiales bacterium]